MSWRLDLYPPQGLLPQLRIAMCVQAWDRMSSPQRNALLRARDRDGSLTDAGREAFRWRPTLRSDDV